MGGTDSAQTRTSAIHQGPSPTALWVHGAAVRQGPNGVAPWPVPSQARGRKACGRPQKRAPFLALTRSSTSRAAPWPGPAHPAPRRQRAHQPGATPRRPSPAGDFHRSSAQASPPEPRPRTPAPAAQHHQLRPVKPSHSRRDPAQPASLSQGSPQSARHECENRRSGGEYPDTQWEPPIAGTAVRAVRVPLTGTLSQRPTDLCQRRAGTRGPVAARTSGCPDQRRRGPAHTQDPGGRDRQDGPPSRYWTAQP